MNGWMSIFSFIRLYLEASDDQARETLKVSIRSFLVQIPWQQIRDEVLRWIWFNLDVVVYFNDLHNPFASYC